MTQTDHHIATTDLPDGFAYSFDGKKRLAKKLSLEDFDNDALQHLDAQAPAYDWVHLKLGSEVATRWLNTCGLDPTLVDGLTAQDPRPRCVVHGDGVLLILRGVNLNPGAEPDDLVSARFWIERHRIIGFWQRPLMAVGELVDAIERGYVPSGPGDLVAKLALRLADRAEPVVAELNERVDVIEDDELDGILNISRRDLAEIRRTSIALRRYMVPQRDALTTLEIEDIDWLKRRDRSRLREAAERVTRLGEELDMIRDRTQIIYDEIMNERAEFMNRNMLVLSVATAIFLPLSLVTGLLGMNVAGIPGASTPGSFWMICGGMVVVAVIQLLIFKLAGFFR